MILCEGVNKVLKRKQERKALVYMFRNKTEDVMVYTEDVMVLCEGTDSGVE